MFRGHTTFGADAALALATGTTLRASYGEGFKAPTLFQLYSFYGNRRLDPETARSFDVGLQQSLLGGRAVALAGEAEAQVASGQTKDHLEGVTAFLEKRPPNFQGA